MKSLLLAKSNLRKNKGLSICIALLILISSMLICVSGLLTFDYSNNAYNVAEDLNTSDISLFSSPTNRRVNIDKINKEYLDSIMPKSVPSPLLNSIDVCVVSISLYS